MGLWRVKPILYEPKLLSQVLGHGLLFDVWKYFKENPIGSVSGLLILFMPVPDPAFPHPAKLS